MEVHIRGCYEWGWEYLEGGKREVDLRVECSLLTLQGERGLKKSPGSGAEAFRKGSLARRLEDQAGRKTHQHLSRVYMDTDILGRGTRCISGRERGSEIKI